MAQGRGTGTLLLACLAGWWGAGCRGDLADDLRDLLAQQGQCATGGAAGQPSPDAGQPSPADVLAPGLIGPLSGSVAGSGWWELFRWELASGTDGARIDFCKDPPDPNNSSYDRSSALLYLGGAQGLATSGIAAM